MADLCRDRGESLPAQDGIPAAPWGEGPRQFRPPPILGGRQRAAGAHPVEPFAQP